MPPNPKVVAPKKVYAAAELFREVQNDTRQLTTGEGVLVEIVDVQSSPRLCYRPRDEIRGIVCALLAIDGFVMPNTASYLRAMNQYASIRLDFVDVLNVARMEREGTATLVSFDRGFDRLPGVIRREP